MTVRHKSVGDPVELGDTLGNGQEPGELWGRLVGIRKDDCPPIRRFIVREFRAGDGWFPTGGYRTTWLLCAWEGWR